MPSISDKVFGVKVENTRVVPMAFKIIAVFVTLLLVSNFASNFFNLKSNQGEQIKLLNQLLTKDLKEIHIFANNQAEIYEFNQDLDDATNAIEQSARASFRYDSSLALGVRRNGELLFAASNGYTPEVFEDDAVLTQMINQMDMGDQGGEEGKISFSVNNQQYLGIYKWHPRWDVFVVRAESSAEFYEASNRIFATVAIIVLAITLISVIIGVFALRKILKFVSVITESMMEMLSTQKLGLINMEGAQNDEVSYLGVAFNSLSNTIDNLMGIFKKFVARDVAAKAYREREIRLDGDSRDLAIMFTDIKGFTFMTETLGQDIITLINMHYTQAIKKIHDNNGDVGSIIGDALLAMFGILGAPGENKSYQAVRTGYQIVEVAGLLRREMYKRREEIVSIRGSLTEAEERVFKAVLLDVGVGLDGGNVFYGLIGSGQRMTNTVIGDVVNASSRLEGLTRVYKVPIIVSEYIKNEVEAEYSNYVFVELDQVQVKGKTIGKKVFWPIETGKIDQLMSENIENFRRGLELYYEGQWKEAHGYFQKTELPMSDLFKNRTETFKPPLDWNGIWRMKEK